jgi:serine/threonine protein kinase
MLEQQEYIGTYIGGYQLTAQLSTSSSSYTFLGETASLTNRQRVVIKWYYAVHLTTQQEKKDFLRQASILKRLQQPFILPILATGLFIDTPYVVTPYMSKGSLYDRIHNPTDQAWLPEHAVSIIKHISQALAYSHQQNIVHGKLHPGNILFNERDEVQLTDFQLTLGKTASTPVNGAGGQKLESYPELATQDNDYHALGKIAHEVFIGCKSLTNQIPNIISDSQNNTPPIADRESHLIPISHTEEASALEPSQHLSDISTPLLALDLPTEKRSSIAIPGAEALPVLANEPSPQTDAPTTGSCINTHTPMATPTLPFTPHPIEANAKKNTIQNPPRPISQSNGMRGNIIRRLLRGQGSLFLIPGVLCIIIFSIIGANSHTTLKNAFA